MAVIRSSGRSKFSFSFISILFGLLVARCNAQAERIFAVKFSRSVMAVKHKEKLEGTACILAAAEVTVRWNMSLVNGAWPYSVWPSHYLWTSSVGQQIEFESIVTPLHLLQRYWQSWTTCTVMLRQKMKMEGSKWRSSLANSKYADDLPCLCSLEAIKPRNQKVPKIVVHKW